MIDLYEQLRKKSCQKHYHERSNFWQKMENINNLEARKKTKKVIARTIIFSKKVS